MTVAIQEIELCPKNEDHFCHESTAIGYRVLPMSADYLHEFVEVRQRFRDYTCQYKFGFRRYFMHGFNLHVQYCVCFRGLAVTAFVMGAGQLVLDLVNVVIILNYAAQCQLVIHYIRGITRRIEEKSTHLQSIMKVG